MVRPPNAFLCSSQPEICKTVRVYFFRIPFAQGTRGAAALCGPVDFAGPALPTPSLHGTEYVRTRLAVVDTTRARLAGATCLRTAPPVTLTLYQLACRDELAPPPAAKYAQIAAAAAAAASSRAQY